MTSSFWARKAEQARENGYTPGTLWENRLRRQLREIKPELYRQLETAGDLENYLQAQVASAYDLEERLRDGGADPFQAREAARQQLADLLRTREDGEDEKPTPEFWTRPEEEAI